MNNTNKTILGIFTLILLIVIPASIYFFINTNKTSQISTTSDIENVKNELKSVDNDNNLLKNVSGNTSSENVQSYLDNNQKNIEQANSKYEKDILLLRSALFSSLNRGTNRDANVTAATKIFNDLITTNDYNSANSAYIKDFAKISLVKMYTEGHTQLPALTESFKIHEVSNVYDKFKNKGYNDDLSKLFTLNFLNDSVSNEYKEDAVYKRNSLDLKGFMLYNYSKVLTPEDKKFVLAEIKREIDNVNNKKDLTYTDYISNTLELNAITAFAIDQFYQNTGINTETNKIIDANYEKVRNEQGDAQVDQIGLNQVKFYNNMRYIYSISTRYPKYASTNFFKQLVDDTIKIANSSKELSAISYGYFSSEQVKNGTFKAGKLFLELSASNNSIKNYLKSIGL